LADTLSIILRASSTVRPVRPQEL